MQWPADKVERRKVADLVPYARNARTHSPEQVDQIAASIKEWGWTTAVLVDEAGEIIAGHGRILAAQKLKIAEVPVMVAVGWTEAQKRAYVIADNKLTLNGGWDPATLKYELLELDHQNFDLSLTGFDEDELADLFAPIGEEKGDPAKLADRFGIPPFSVLNAREGWWQDRKRAWLALGIQSELGRGDTEADASFKNQGALRALQDGKPHRKPNAIPGGGNDAARACQKGKS
jgi:hypothetical protein